MSSSPEDFKELRRLLALKRHEQPPPGYFTYLPDQIMVKIERGGLAEHSTWWEWLVERFDARPLVAGAYACAISGLMILGFKVSQDLQASHSLLPELPLAEGPHPLNFTPSATIQSHFANPAGLVIFSTGDSPFEATNPFAPAASFSLEGGNFAQ